MPNILSVQNLCCEKGSHPLFDQLNFTLTEGQMLQIRGLNGVGKTSLLRMIAGLSFIKEGEIFWNSKLISDIREEYALKINYIGHKLGLKEDLSVFENLQLYFRATNGDLINHALTQFDLKSKSSLLIRELSAGQKRRVALAKLLLLPAKLWILDEPFTAIDSQGINILIHLMKKQQQQGGMIIFASHHEIALTADKKELHL